MSQMMRGPTVLRGIMSDFLSAQMPAAINVMRAQYGMLDYQLPYPVKYDTIDPTLATGYPSIGMTALNIQGFTRTDVGAEAEQEYRPNYSCRIIVIARTPELPDGGWEQPTKEAAVRVMNDLVMVATNCLLQTPSLGLPGKTRMDESTVLTDFLEPIQTKTQGQRWIAMGLITCTISLLETTYSTAIGHADTVTTEVDKLNP